jgi:hypothetical protein
MHPRVAIVVLTYNGVEDTLACLGSLERINYPHERYEVVVVDNASSDGTVARVRAEFPTATLIENASNLGFAAGNNVGLRYALEQGFGYVLLLNNDTEVGPDFLGLLVDAAEADSSVGVAGPTIYYHHSPRVVWSAGGIIDWRRGTSAMRGLDKLDQGQFTAPAEVDFVSGCALLCKSTALRQAGLLDERFFMYYEETEWCVRITRAGFRCLHVPGAHIWHKILPERQAQSPRVAYYMARNRLLFLRATRAPLRAWTHALILQDLRTLLSLSLRPKWRARRGQRDALLRAWLDFGCGHFGFAELG